VKQAVRLASRKWLTSPGFCLVIVFALFCLRTLPAPTPAGIHCPTAPVQSVVEDGLMRAPLPGEAEFMQCRCAEAKAEAKLAESDGASGWLVCPAFLEVEALPFPGIAAVVAPLVPGAGPSAPKVAGPPSAPLPPPPRLI
jgi:hypothetical protein